MRQNHFDGETCEWLAPERRQLFSLAPFEVHGSDAPSVLAGGARRLLKGGDAQWVLVAALGPLAHVARYYGSSTEASRRAVDLAKWTGDPVVVARQAGLDAGGMPVFESFGRVLTAKADPLSVEAFEAWVTSMTSRITGVSRADLAVMATEALEHLEIVLTPGTTAAQLDGALAGYRTTIANPTARMMSAQRVEISRTLRTVLSRTGAATARIPQVSATLAAGFRVPDREASQLLSRHHSFWVRDRHGDISRTMSERARGIISAGMDRGAGRVELGHELSQMTGRGLRQPHYYETVAANHVARARSFSTVSTYQAAGIEQLRWESVLDDRTTFTCMHLHGRVFSVGAAMGRMNRVLEDPNPEAVVSLQPFIRERGDHLSITNPDGTSRRVADITSRGVGMTPSGPSATFTSRMSGAEMSDAGIGLPPSHHRCRSCTVPA